MRVNEKSLMARNLDYFHTLYKVGSYADAAKLIPMTYQGLKKSMKALEADLGVVLFDVTQDGTAIPTPYADELYGLAQEWARDARRLAKTFRDIRVGAKEVIDIAAIQGFCTFIGDGLMERFSLAHSEFVLDIAQYPDSSLDDLLSEGVFDIAVVADSQIEGFDLFPLTEWTNCVWMSPDHPKAGWGELTLADLGGEDIMIPDHHYKTGRFFSRKIEEGLCVPRSVRYCSHLSDSFFFVLRGCGMGIGNERVLHAFPDLSEVSALPLRDGFSNVISLAVREGHVLSDNEVVAIDFLKAQSKKRNASWKRGTSRSVG